MPTVQEFAAKVKQQYPEYAGIADADLVGRMVAKYPVYADQIDFGSEKNKFQVMRSGREALNVSNGALPGSKAPTPSPISDLAQAGVQTVSDIPGFLGDAAARVGQNIAGVAHIAMHPIDTASSIISDKAGHIANAAHAYLSGDPVTGALESYRVTPGSGLVEGTLRNVAGTLTGDRTAAANLTGDVATAALPEMAGAVKNIPVVGRAVDTLGDKLPPRLMNNMVNTGSRYFRFGNNPGEALVGIKPSLLEGIDGFKAPLDAKIQTLSNQADAILSHPIAQMKNLDVVGEAIEPVIKAARQDAIDGGISTAAVDSADEALHGIVNKYVGPDGRITPQQAQLIKQRIGDVTKWASDTEGVTRNGIYQDAYSAVDKLIDEAVPPVKGLNERMANALTAKKVVENAAQMKLKDSLSLKSLLTMPYVRSRAASTLRTVFGQMGDVPSVDVPANDRFSPVPSPYSPEMAASLKQARVPQLPPGRSQLALPPAPENAPEGFISSDELRRVGTRLGPTEGGDSAVYAPQNELSPPQFGHGPITPPPSQTAPQSLSAPSPPQMIQMLMDRKNSNLLDMVMSKDFRDLAESLAHERRLERLKAFGVRIQ